ncbi:MAG: hypothetical protein JOY64_35515 [Alphaproteobacteria bacterium]|nr:hypothetical protein [Alphaproteobacteria bacterium]MBV8412976.1 hypothetical protein [Alphaproteobacteria bacterium]
MTTEMDPANFRDDPLSYLENRELSGITFVRDYVQLHFDSAFINAFVWPTITTGDKAFKKQTPGYRDVLCDQIGQHVVAAVAMPDTSISVHFQASVLEISLRDKDRIGPESATFQDGSGKLWSVW